MAKVKVWDGVESINNIPAEDILANREDLRNALGDIFLVMDDAERVVSEIQIGNIIAANYNMEAGLTIQEIADAYLVKKQEEAEAAEEERLTNHELQEEVAALSYDVMMLEAQSGIMALSMEAGVNENGEAVHSVKFKMIKIWFKKGFWTVDMVQDACGAGCLTEAEVHEIVGE